MAALIGEGLKLDERYAGLRAVPAGLVVVSLPTQGDATLATLVCLCPGLRLGPYLWDWRKHNGVDSTARNSEEAKGLSCLPHDYAV